MTSTKSIAAAIKSIPGMKEGLKKAFEELESHSSSLASFTLQWKDIEDHFSSIEKSIGDRFRDLQSREKDNPSKSASSQSPEKYSPAAAKTGDEPEATPRPELKSVCAKMDGKGLQAFINANRKSVTQIRPQITPAIRAALDPAKLVLDAMGGFYPVKSKGENPSDGEIQANRRTCILLLESLRVISPEIKPPVMEKVKKLAEEWKGKISNDGGENALEALAFLQLLASYGLSTEFEAGELLDLLILVSKRKQTVDLCRDLIVAEKIPDFIQKLSNKGKQLDAVKFVYAFELVDKFPPVSLLKAHIMESKKIAQEVLKRGNNSKKSQNEATDKELAAVKAVIKTIEEYKLQSQYSPHNLEKRVAQLEQQKAGKKRTATNAAVPNSKTDSQKQHEQANKRPRPSTTTTHSQLSLTDHVPYLHSTGPYSLTGNGSVYHHAGSSYMANPVGFGANQSAPRSYLYSSESIMSSGLYDRPMLGSYPLSGGLPQFQSYP